MSAGLPRAFGRYALLSSLGRGGMGEVFLARHGALEGAERLCVVKTLRGDLANNTEYLGRFLDEARIVVQLSHAGICHVFDAGRVEDDVYIAMEFIPGVNLRVLLSALQDVGASLSPSLALHIASEVLDALAYAHRLRHRTTGAPLHVVHRDVSPHNVMVSFEGEVKLIDFGLAESDIKEEHTATQQVLGKVAYMSPEQARGDSVDAATDQFATAIMLYEMLTQDRFYGEMSTHQIWQIVGHGGFKPRFLDRLPPPVVPILERALASTVEERYPSCDEMRDAVDDVRSRHFPGSGKRDLRQQLHASFAAQVADTERMVARASALQIRVPEDESGSQTNVDASSSPAPIDLPLGVDGSGEGRSQTRPSKSRAPTASEARAFELAPPDSFFGPPPPSMDPREHAVLYTETDLKLGTASDFVAVPPTVSESSAFVSSDSSAPTPSLSIPLSPPPTEMSRVERAWQRQTDLADDTARVARVAARSTTGRRTFVIVAATLITGLLVALVLVARRPLVDDTRKNVVVTAVPGAVTTTAPDTPTHPPFDEPTLVQPTDDPHVGDEQHLEQPTASATTTPTKRVKPGR